MDLATLTAGTSTANPWAAAGSLILQSMFQPSVEQSKLNGLAVSGQSTFGGANEQVFKKPLLDFSDPIKVGLMCAALIGGMLIYKKYRG